MSDKQPPPPYQPQGVHPPPPQQGYPPPRQGYPPQQPVQYTAAANVRENIIWTCDWLKWVSCLLERVERVYKWHLRLSSLAVGRCSPTECSSRNSHLWSAPSTQLSMPVLWKRGHHSYKEQDWHHCHHHHCHCLSLHWNIGCHFLVHPFLQWCGACLSRGWTCCWDIWKKAILNNIKFEENLIKCCSLAGFCRTQYRCVERVDYQC